MDNRNSEKVLNPVSFLAGRTLVAAVHGQQVPHSHGIQIVGHILRQLVRKEIDDAVVKTEQAFVDSHAYGSGCECLADRMHHVRLVGGSPVIPLFEDHLAMLEDHYALESDLIHTLIGGDYGIHSLLY